MKNRHETAWVELGFMPVSVGYVPTTKAWHKTLKELGLADEPRPTTPGRCLHWVEVGPNKTDIVLIVVGKQAKDVSMAQVIGIIAHECQHAWRYIREAIGEAEPSSEFEAYVLQALVQVCVRAHAERQRKPWKKANA